MMFLIELHSIQSIDSSVTTCGVTFDDLISALKSVRFVHPFFMLMYSLQKREQHYFSFISGEVF